MSVEDLMRPREDHTFGDHFWSGQSSGSFLEWTIFWITFGNVSIVHLFRSIFLGFCPQHGSPL